MCPPWVVLGLRPGSYNDKTTVQVLHGRFTHFETTVQALHGRFTHCEIVTQALHGLFTHCEIVTQALHSHFTHFAAIRRLCMAIVTPAEVEAPLVRALLQLSIRRL